MGVVQNIRAAFGAVPRPDYLASPLTDGQLSSIVFSEFFGPDYKPPMSRADALAIPAVSKARMLICGTIAQWPLRAANAAGLLDDAAQPSWMYRTDGGLSPFHRMLMTVDDLIFYDQALWEVVRGSEGQILTADRVPYSRWRVTPEGAILVNEKPVSADSVIYFPGPFEGVGLLDRGAASLREARDIDGGVAKRASIPAPVAELSITDDVPRTKRQLEAIRDGYVAARLDPNGAVVVTPQGVELKLHGDQTDSGFATEGRNGVRLNVANLTGVPASLLDGSTATASLTYSTQAGRRNEFIDYGLSMWAEAIAGRLSQDDVVPRGQHTVLDMTDWLTTLPDPTGPKEQD